MTMERAKEILMRRLEKRENGCWEWMGGLSPSGYGQFSCGPPRRHFFVHRLAYELFVGPIPNRHHIHHRCQNRRCCNPEHLEALSPRAHAKISPGHPANVIHCPKGHPYDKTNTYVIPATGERECRLCREANRLRFWREHPEYKREWRKKRRALGFPVT